jgi:superfamily I DNA and RNA helicase
MAKFFPEFEKIQELKQKPTDGELYALEKLKDLPDGYEVYFQPFINGHNPDIIVVRENYGVLIIEVKDWKLKHYEIDKKDNWILRKEKVSIKSPVKQVEAYKNDLYNLSIPSLLNAKIRDKKYYGIVQTAVYFHNESSSSIKNYGVITNKFCPVYGKNNFMTEKLEKYSLRKYPNSLFNDKIYKEFQRILKPSFHTLEQAQPVNLSKKQKQLVKSEDKQQKIRGVAGSGKTLVLAQRAVNSHIRHGEPVLILTYNITLRNYIHDNLNRVRQEFDWRNFYIINYDAFIFSEANNHNIIKNIVSSDINLWVLTSQDPNLFESVKHEITKYPAIFIDEIQDYKEEWIRIVKKYFLKDGGEFVVFGDEKQNVYDQKLDKDKKPNTTISGAWNKLDESFRLSNKILQLAEKFQDKFFKEKYELDKAIPKQQEIDFNEESIEYYKFNDSDTMSDLSNFIIEKSKENNIQPQNICILAHTNQLLRELDFKIRDVTKQKTYTTFETQEMYEFLKYNKSNGLELENEIKTIRKNKRFNFWMNAGGMKLSTVHSFKGWEIDTLFLIIDNKSNHEAKEIIYTALTRCRNKLFIININNDIYDEFFSENIQNNINRPKPNKKQKDDNQKTIGETIRESNTANISYNFSQLRKQEKFNILILGEISESQSNFKQSLNNYFEKHNIATNQWNLYFWNNRDIKKKDIRSLRKGQSKYDLLVTGQIHQHSSKGNKQSNLISELMKPQYVKRIYGSTPKKILTTDTFINKIDEYITKVV